MLRIGNLHAHWNSPSAVVRLCTRDLMPISSPRPLFTTYQNAFRLKFLSKHSINLLTAFNSRRARFSTVNFMCLCSNAVDGLAKHGQEEKIGLVDTRSEVQSSANKSK